MKLKLNEARRKKRKKEEETQAIPRGENFSLLQLILSFSISVISNNNYYTKIRIQFQKQRKGRANLEANSHISEKVDELFQVFVHEGGIHPSFKSQKEYKKFKMKKC